MIRLTRHVYAHCLHWISSSIALTAQSCSCCTVYTICHCRPLVVAVRPGTGQFKLPGRFELRTPSDETYRQKVIRLKKLLFVFFIQTYCWIPQRRHRNSDTTRIGVHHAALWLSLSLFCHLSTTLHWHDWLSHHPSTTEMMRVLVVVDAVFLTFAFVGFCHSCFLHFEPLETYCL